MLGLMLFYRRESCADIDCKFKEILTMLFIGG